MGPSSWVARLERTVTSQLRIQVCAKTPPNDVAIRKLRKLQKKSDRGCCRGGSSPLIKCTSHSLKNLLVESLFISCVGCIKYSYKSQIIEHCCATTLNALEPSPILNHPGSNMHMKRSQPRSEVRRVTSPQSLFSVIFIAWLERMRL